MTPMDEYLARVARGLAGMDPRIREDILKEFRSHVADATREEGDGGIRAMEAPEAVAARYKAMYGYGSTYRAILAAVAAVLAVPTLPIFLYAGVGSTVTFALTLAFLAVLVAYLMVVAVKAGSAAGLGAGLSACLARFASLAVFSATAEAVVPDVNAGVLFVAVSALLVLLGFLPGRAREKWRPKDVTM